MIVMSTGHNWMIWLSRSVFTALLLFEILNLFGVLHVTITFSWLLLIITQGVVWALVEMLWRELGRLGAPEKGWLLFFVVAAVLLDFFGDTLGLYGKFNHYDQIAHFIGGLAAAIAITIMLRAKQVIPDVVINANFSFRTQLLLVVSLAALLGLFYEFGEFLDTRYFGHNSLGDQYDTLNDLFLNIAGALTGGIVSLKNLHLSFFQLLKKFLKKGV